MLPRCPWLAWRRSKQQRGGGLGTALSTHQIIKACPIACNHIKEGQDQGKHQESKHQGERHIIRNDSTLKRDWRQEEYGRGQEGLARGYFT